MQSTFFIGNFVSITHSNTTTYTFSSKVASFSFAIDFFFFWNFFLNWITQRMPPRNNQSLFYTVDTVKASSFVFLFSSKTVSIYEVQISSISQPRQKLHCYISILTKSLFKAQKPISLVFKFTTIFSHASPLLVCSWNYLSNKLCDAY